MTETSSPENSPRFIYPPIQQYDEVWHTKNVDVNQKVIRAYAQLGTEVASLKDQSVQVKDKVSPVPHLGNLWHQVRLGAERTNSGERSYRGYVMAEPERMDIAVLKLLAVAKQRWGKGKRTEFKWLISCNAAASEQDVNDLGVYRNLEIDASRIVVYADDPAEIKEIFQNLVDQGWDEIEETRIKACGGEMATTPRRDSGSNEFLDDQQKYWRSLNWNGQPGHADDQFAQGQGRPMQEVTYPKPPRFSY